MRLIRRLLIGSLLMSAFVVWWQTGRRAESATPAGKIARNENQVVPAAPRTGPSPRASPSPTDPVAPGSIGSREILRRLAYAQAWSDPQPPALAAFRGWAKRYQQAATANARSALAAEGISLARERRPVMRELIVDDPQRALSLAIPATVRQTLPAAVLAELETRVAGKGDYELLATTFESGASPASAPLRRVAFIDRVEYQAHVYGRRAEQTTKEGASLHGIALDGELALHESPLRVLEPGEIPQSAAAATCPVSDLAVAPLNLAAGVNRDSLDVVEAAGRIFEFCGGAHMLEDFAQRLADGEGSSDPRVTLPLSGAAEPRTGAEVATAWTTGNTKVLIIRVDFSDKPGEFITEAAAQTRMDNDVRAFYEASSYGQDTMTSTVTTKVYRMPETADHYGTLNAVSALHADARAAASADYNVANFDRVGVVFPGSSSLSRRCPAGRLLSGRALGSIAGVIFG